MPLLPYASRTHLRLLLIVAAIGTSAPTAAQNSSREGRILAFECGDNCDLAIIDKLNKELTGLCTAPECAKWNEEVSMPSHYKGKRVAVTLGRGVQLDGGGNKMGEMLAFKKVRFLDEDNRAEEDAPLQDLAWNGASR
jgi:hypothetical protein